ncbi:MAG: Flp family type IVb pilin [Deltaproteobacteria bacterium]|nr:MAG: Flp family type IVb pilin [Deltaproteobacteria bacterium]
MEILNELWRDESGASAVEYALIAGLMAAALVGVISTFKDSLTGLFDKITGQMDQAQQDISGGGGGGGQGG